VLDRLIDHGNVLDADRDGILAFVRKLYNAAPAA
jgi:hypothetical protein